MPPSVLGNVSVVAIGLSMSAWCCQFPGSTSFEHFNVRSLLTTELCDTPVSRAIYRVDGCVLGLSSVTTDNEVFNGIDVLRRACWTSPAVINLPFHSIHPSQIYNPNNPITSVPVLIRKFLNKPYWTVAFRLPQVFKTKIDIPLLTSIMQVTHRKTVSDSSYLNEHHYVSEWQQQSFSVAVWYGAGCRTCDCEVVSSNPARADVYQRHPGLPSLH